MERNKEYRIWYRQYDDNGNLIGEGRSEKIYKREGNALNAAHRLYAHVPGIDYEVCWRNPFVEYTQDVRCPLCCKTHTIKEEAAGWTMTNHLTLRDWSKIYTKVDSEGFIYQTSDCIYLRDICPDCTAAIRKCIDSLTKGEKDDWYFKL